jgi:hypothetical protein
LPDCGDRFEARVHAESSEQGRTGDALRALEHPAGVVRLIESETAAFLICLDDVMMYCSAANAPAALSGNDDSPGPAKRQ